MNLANAKNLILDVPNYPKTGIVFKDITPLLADSKALNLVISTLAERLSKLEIDYVAGIEARGFIIGAALSNELQKGFLPIRKPGKLPREVFKQSYQLEYGSDSLEIHTNLIPRNSKILIVDDVLATGGTAVAAGKLILDLDCQVSAFAFLFAIDELSGCARIQSEGFNVATEVLF